MPALHELLGLPALFVVLEPPQLFKQPVRVQAVPRPDHHRGLEHAVRDRDGYLERRCGVGDGAAAAIGRAVYVDLGPHPRDRHGVGLFATFRRLVSDETDSEVHVGFSTTYQSASAGVLTQWGEPHFGATVIATSPGGSDPNTSVRNGPGVSFLFNTHRFGPVQRTALPA